MAATEQGNLFLISMAELTTADQGQVLELVETYQTRNSNSSRILHFAAIGIIFWAIWAMHKYNLID